MGCNTIVVVFKPGKLSREFHLNAMFLEFIANELLGGMLGQSNQIWLEIKGSNELKRIGDQHGQT